MESGKRKLTGPLLAALMAGNVLDFYNFLVFSVFAGDISAAFFPESDNTSSLLLMLATLGVGFATRPLGAVMLGTLGDTWGRRPALVLSLGIMGVATAGMALTPSFAEIGWLGTALGLSFRLLQGFALGGEVGPVVAMLAEGVEPKRRGLAVSLSLGGQYAANLVAVSVGLALGQALPGHGEWAWRAAMLLGAGAVPVALWLRRALPETLTETRARAPRRDGSLLRKSVISFCLLAAATVGTYSMSYLSIFAVETLHMTPAAATVITLVTSSAALLGAVAGGWLSDLVGRRLVMIGAALMLLPQGLIWFALMGWLNGAPLVLMAGLCMSLAVGAGAAPGMAAIAEMMPGNLRAGGVGILYALAVSSLGSTAPFTMSWLVGETGSPLMPAWYLSAAALVGLLAVLAMPETAPLKGAGWKAPS